MKKKFVCMLLTLAVVFSLCGSLTLSAAAADSGKCGDNLTWSLTDGTLTISGTGDMYDYRAFAFLSPWFEKSESITTVIIEDGVTSIGDEAFSWHTVLTSVTIPDSVTTIGHKAFEVCTVLKSITIPDSVTTIGEKAFYACTALTSVTIPSSVTLIDDNAFRGCDNLTELLVDKENKVYHSADNCIIETASKTLIQGCKNSKIPTDGSVTSIGGGAFAFCSDLTRIAIPNAVTSIDDEAFYASALKSVTIGNGVKTIGNSAFYGCFELETIYFTGSEEQWNAIAKGEGWDEDAGAYALMLNADPSGIRYDGDYIYGIAPGTTVDKLKKEDIVVKDAKNGIVGTGAKVVVDGKEYTVVIKGDIDGDGNINATDYLKVRLHILKRIQLEDSNLLAAHVSTKTEKPVSAADYTAIRLHILKKKLVEQ